MTQGRVAVGVSLLAVLAGAWLPSLQAGPALWPVRGSVIRSDTGGPVAGARVDFIDLLASEAVVAGDTAGPFGAYEVLLPEGIYAVRFRGPDFPVGSLLTESRLDEVSVDGSGDVRVPDVVLVPGYRVSGHIADSASVALEGAFPVFRSVPSGLTVYAIDDLTDAAGDFEVLVPPGTYDVAFHPPPGLGLASASSMGVSILGDDDLGGRMLTTGVPLTGQVLDPLGRPQRGVAWQVTQVATGQPVATAPATTDGAGQFQTVVPAGSRIVRFESTVNSFVDPELVVTGGLSDLPTVELPFHNEDGDFAEDVFDNCPFRNTLFQEDFDGDGLGGLCDNCPLAYNPRQENNDGSGGGDACDPDDDNDGLADGSDPDRDGDLVFNVEDNCPAAANPGQEDVDDDGAGDACDPDDGMIEHLEARTRTGYRWRREAGVLGYQVYRVPLWAVSGINYGTCFHDTDGDHAFMRDVALPDPGQGFAYLVTGVMPAGEGSTGRRSDGQLRPNLRPCPPEGP